MESQQTVPCGGPGRQEGNSLWPGLLSGHPCQGPPPHTPLYSPHLTHPFSLSCNDFSVTRAVHWAYEIALSMILALMLGMQSSE